MIFYKTKDGKHYLQQGEFRGMGGELEDVFVWCHTCDPKGSNLMIQEYNPVESLSSHGHLLMLALDMADHIGVPFKEMHEHLERLA